MTRFIVVGIVGLGLALAGIAGAGKPEPSVPGWEATLGGGAAPSRTLRITGRLIGLDGHPAGGLRMQVYHADPSGRYELPGETHMRFSGVVRTSPAGELRIRTVVPGPAEGNPHVHFVIEGSDRKYRMMTVNLAREAGAGSDSAYARLPRMPQLPATGDWAHVRPDSGGGFLLRRDLELSRIRAMPEPPRDFGSPTR